MDEDRLNRKKQRAKREGNIQLLAETIKELGDLYFETGRLENALQEYLEQLEACEILGDKLNCAIAHRMIGEVNASLGDYEQALTHQNLHLEGAREVKNLLEEQRAFATLGRTYFCLAESLPEENDKKISALSNAKKAYTKSIRLCNNLENSDIKLEEMMTMRARLLLNLGLVLEAQKEPQQAIDLIQKATALCEKYNLHEDLHRTHLALGAIYERQSNFEQAESHLDTAAEINNVTLKAEARLAKAELFLRMGKWSDARKILVSLYLTKGIPHSTNQQIQKLLRIAVTLCRGEENLIIESNVNAKQDLCESLGDAAVAVRCFEKAIDYYQNMLLCAEESGSNRVSAALISLAQTLKDAGRCNEALLYAQRELKLCTDPRETCRSAVFLADLLVASKSSDKEIQAIYNLALNNAKECENLSLEVSVLKDFLYYLESVNKSEEAKLIKEKLEKLSNIISDSESENESETEDIGADICLDELSDVEERITNNENGCTTRKRYKRGLVVKRNEKGETQLHVACINGNIDNVEKLLAAGHPTNLRDHCGWTPLHEAANHGHIEIAKLLLQNGANVNDPGGSLCGGVTPLHDAASCGNLSMMNLLMTHGANINLKTSDGDTVLDCLEGWKDRAEDLSASELSEYNYMYNKLSAVLPTSKKKDKNLPPRNRKTPWNQLIDDEDEEEDKPTTTKKLSAGEDYKRTIASLKHRGGIISSTVNRKIPRIVTPLIDNEDALLEDWLEDDIGINTNSKRTSVPTSTLAYTERHSVITKRKSNSFNLDDENSPKRIKTDSEESTTESDTHIEDSNQSCGSNQSSNQSEEVEIFSKTNKLRKKQKRQVSLFKSGFSKDSTVRTPSPSFLSIERIPVHVSNTDSHSITKFTDHIINIRIFVEEKEFDLKLNIQDRQKDFLVNITNDIKKRFYDETGCKIECTLKTIDDKTINSEHFLNLVSNHKNTEILKADVSEIHIPSIVERYNAICTNNDIEVREHITKWLKSCENTSVFRLRPYEITDEEIVPLLKVLEYEKRLHILHLSGGVLIYNADLLNQCLKRLSTLHELYLQGCDIDFDCLASIKQLPVQLRVLDLSYNPLGRKSEETLLRLLSPLKYLQTLHLKYCDLSSFRFPLDSNNLINLDISWNSLNDNDVCNFLQRQLLSLNLSNVTHRREHSLVTNIINNSRLSFTNIDCLNLASCYITDSDVKSILTNALNLSKIYLSGNINLTCASINMLLNYEPTLTYIDVSGCKNITEPPDSGVFIKNPEMCTLVTSMVAEVRDAWLYLWRGKGTLQELPYNVTVFRPL